MELMQETCHHLRAKRQIHVSETQTFICRRSMADLKSEAREKWQCLKKASSKSVTYYNLLTFTYDGNNNGKRIMSSWS